MKWIKFKIKTITEAEDIIISTLCDIGLEGAQIEDKIPLTAVEKEQMFVDILPEGPEDDGIAYLSFFVEEKEDGSLEVQGEPATVESIIESVQAELDDLRNFMEIGEGTITIDEAGLVECSDSGTETSFSWEDYRCCIMCEEAIVVVFYKPVMLIVSRTKETEDGLVEALLAFDKERTIYEVEIKEKKK